MDVAETSLQPGFGSLGLAYAIALSIGLHLLLLWLTTNWFQIEWNRHSPSSARQPLRVSITQPRSIHESTQRQTGSIETAADPAPEEKPPQKKDPLAEIQAKPVPHPTSTSIPPISGSTRERTVTTAQIRRSAAATARDMAKDNTGEQAKEADAVSATLERVLNKPRETPGIYTQADGTTRVVTEQGFTYCIKALNDWRILDPGEDMRVSMYCK
ncbi:hypothetical protein [Candidatus Thiodiazotropha sp. LNASS1]|uniref:hypothetical protein n=1 Tax=Candidatus Thiodiazotropha sp. LNASS1 TaxID=3096260 RepID=UPI0034DF7D96